MSAANNRVSFFRRLALSLWHRRILGKNRRRVVVMDGVKYRMQFRGGDRRIILDGEIESRQFDYLAREIRAHRCDALIDIGANIGAYSLRAAKEKLCGEIFAIEGSGRNFARLQENIALNGAGGAIKPMCAVLSDAKRTARFYDDNAYDNQTAGLDGSVAAARGKYDAVAEVETAALDGLFDFRGRRIAIKLDVEGHELPVLRGAQKLLAANEVVLQCEVWPHNGAAIAYLISRGFSISHFIGADSGLGCDFFFRNFQAAANGDSEK
jgi:FkbM family methyltransferase